MKLKSQWFEQLNDQNIEKIKRMEGWASNDLSYFMKRVFATLQSQSIAFFEQKKEIIDKYKNGDGNISHENMPKFLIELSKLHEIEVDFPFEEKRTVSLDDLPAMSPYQLDFIEPFFIIKEPEK